MNPADPFGGQPPGGLGAFPAKAPFRFGQSGPAPARGTGFAPTFGAPPGAAHCSPPALGFPQAAAAGLPPGPERAPAFATASGPPASCAPASSAFSFKPPGGGGGGGAFPGPPAFGLDGGEAASAGFGKTDFSFRPLDSSVFRPIAGPEPGPEQAQSQTPPGFFSFAHPGGGGGPGGPTPFSFAQAAGAPAASSSFAFPKPVGGSPAASAFTPPASGPGAEEDKSGPGPLFGSPGGFAGFPGPPAGPPGEPFKAGARPGSEEAAAPMEPPPGLAKGLKRKDEQDRSPRRHGHEVAAEPDAPARAEHPPDKRPLRLSRPRGGTLFGRTIQDVFRSNKEAARPGGKEPRRDPGLAEPAEGEPAAGPGPGQPAPAAPWLPGTSAEEAAEGRDRKEGSRRGAPGRRSRRSESADSLGAVPPAEVTAIQCKNVPDALNDRATLESYFGRFARVQRVCVRRSKKLAVVHFFDHASAALARKKGKGLHEDVAVFWHRKKISPSKKPPSLKEKPPGEGAAGPGAEDAAPPRAPLGKPLPRAGAGGLLSKGSPVKKPGLLKLEGDPADGAPEGPECPAPGASSLSALVGTVAETSEEKFRLLDQRDRIMRQARVRRTGLDEAQAFVGTCADMCPEKERYLRETRSQLSAFEMLPGTDQVDHAAAVKEYSRSSADQEEPLPHELRPPAVLRRTMDYLVTRVLDQREGGLRDWYDFVWNRTRGIRKDITQQRLCDPLTVSLIESCARFHIHCAHFLCEEPPSCFDAKINQENTTKCLQSLKEMYQDLRARGVLCAREAEFQAYSVLLGLNRGDALREVQQLQPAVRNSAEVKFAVQAFAALNSNNFVRFFKLVQAASYLSACLLHGYFNQIRRDALRALSVAYTVSPQRAAAFPLDGLVRMLLFRDADEAAAFLGYHGLSVHEGCVELSRTAFLEPEGPCKAHRSPLISRKLTVSVGEVVHGGPLPPAPRHTPACSFNAQNKFVGESLAVEPPAGPPGASLDTAGGAGGESIALETDAPPPPPPPAATPLPLLPPPEPLPAQPTPAYSELALAQVMEELVQEVVQKDLEEVGAAGAAFAATALGVSSAATEELLAAATTDLLRHVAAEELAREQARAAEAQRQQRERARVLAALSQGLAAELTELVVADCLREACSQELRSALEAERRARTARCCEHVCARLVAVFLEEEVLRAARETLQELRCFRKYLQRWRDAVAARKKLRRQMRAFPAAPCCVDAHDRLQALAPSAQRPITRENLARGLLDLGHAGRLGVSCTRLRWLRSRTTHQMKVQHFQQQLLSDAAWAPLDVTSLAAEHLPGVQQCVFWKLVLALPGDEELPPGGPGRELADWLKVKLAGPGGPAAEAGGDEPAVHTLSLLSTQASRGGRAVSVNVCVKAARGLLSDRALDAAQTRKELLGAGGLLLLLPPAPSGGAEDSGYWPSALLRLQQLLRAKPFQPALPLAVLLPGRSGAAAQQDAEDGLRLPDLVAAELLSAYSVVGIPDSVSDARGSAKVAQAVQWLLARCPRSLDLGCRTLVQFVEDGVGREFSSRFFHDRRQRRRAGLGSQEPGAVVELFNSVLRFLAGALASERLLDLSWPVAEFARAGGSRLLPHLQWNSPEHLAWLRRAVLGLQLPRVDLPPAGVSWLQACSAVARYAAQIPSARQARPVLQSQVDSLLRRAQLRWRRLSRGRGTSPPASHVPWDDVIALCVNHRLRDWTPPGLPVVPEALGADGQVCVYFLREQLRGYTAPLRWEQARLRTQRELQLGPGSRSGVKSFPPPTGQCPAADSPAPGGVRPHGEPGVGGLPSGDALARGACAQELLAQCLSRGLLLEKEESRRFEDQLQRWLAEDAGPVEPRALPRYLPQTLVSLPRTLGPGLRPPAPARAQDRRARARPQVPEASGASLTERLTRLEQLLRSSREESAASELHLATLLDVVDI